MSYEGYSQLICAKGHYSIRDAYDGDDRCYCGEKYVWTNSVDQTNDDGFPFPQDTLIITPKSGCAMCDPDNFKPAAYRVPTSAEMDKYHADKKAFYDKLYGGSVEEMCYDEYCECQEWDDDTDDHSQQTKEDNDCLCNTGVDPEVDLPPLETKEDIAREMSDCINTCGLKGEELYVYILGMLKEST